MIIRNDISPKYNIYYIGAQILKKLKEHGPLEFGEILIMLEEVIDGIGVSSVYYSLDWLYMIGGVELEDGRLMICD